MVDKIGPPGPRFIRISPTGGPTPVGPRATPAAEAASMAQTPAQASATRSMKHRVLLRLAGIDKIDPRRRSKAMRAFIEVRLLDEWGDRLGNDPGFHQLVDDVLTTMQHNDALKADMDRAIDQLLSED